MGLGLSLVLIAAGAVLTYAVDGSVGGVEIASVGVLSMVLGAVGLLISMVILAFPGRQPAGLPESAETPNS